MRARILMLLRGRPMNPHQLSLELGVNYRTVTHHLKVLEDNGPIRRLRQGYGTPYVLSEEAVEGWSVIEESIRRVLGERP